ncbi:MAG: glutathione S-transferase N-terminal domain-containing protein [Xanthomonadales bacterium]|nr:glutathione S-transferase N-terminal domain-containing protein [Xanthomonadales bacterium]
MLDFYTAATPNGYKVSIALEEMGFEYQLKLMNFSKKDQHSPEFTKISPNGKIPTIVDHNNDGFALAESGAILIYLAEKCGKFYGHDDKSRYQVLQWLMFQMSGIGPMMGQANVFYRYMEEEIPAAIARYHNEVHRLFGVMDKQLEKTEFIAGEYSIADMATYPWIFINEWSGTPVDDFPQVQRWMETIAARPAVKTGMNTPPQADPSKIIKSARKIITR